MSTAPPIDTSVSPALDPSILDAPQVAAPLTIGQATDGSPVLHPALTASRAAMKTMHDSSAALAEAERAIKATNDPAANKRLRAGAEKRLADATKASADALDVIARHREKVCGEIDEALGIPEARTSVTAAMRASDIRAHIRSLGTPAARMEAVRAAISAGDREAAAAALSCSPLALGITQREADTLRDFAEHQFARPLVAIRDGLDKVRGIVENADRITTSRFGSLIGRGDSREARAEAALRNLEGGAA